MSVRVAGPTQMPGTNMVLVCPPHFSQALEFLLGHDDDSSWRLDHNPSSSLWAAPPSVSFILQIFARDQKEQFLNYQTIPG